jgi:hypothetical protein
LESLTFSTQIKVRSLQVLRLPTYSKNMASLSVCDGKGRFLDNVFIERLWCSLKYEEFYLHAYDTPKEVRVAIDRCLNF